MEGGEVRAVLVAVPPRSGLTLSQRLGTLQLSTGQTGRPFPRFGSEGVLGRESLQVRASAPATLVTSLPNTRRACLVEHQGQSPVLGMPGGLQARWTGDRIR